MADQFVRWSLERIYQAARKRTVTPVAGESAEVVSRLNWYILLKAPISRGPGADEENRAFENQLHELGVQAIWYQDGGHPDWHRGLLEVMQGIQRETRGLTVAEPEPGFLENLLEAERLAPLASPTKSDVRLAKAIVRGHPRIASAFLDRVDGVDWFRSLRDAGALAPKPKFVTG